MFSTLFLNIIMVINNYNMLWKCVYHSLDQDSTEKCLIDIRNQLYSESSNNLEFRLKVEISLDLIFEKLKELTNRRSVEPDKSSAFEEIVEMPIKSADWLAEIEQKLKDDKKISTLFGKSKN